MAKNYDLFLERMKQKYNVPQTTYKPQTALQKQNALSKNQDTFYNPAQAEQPQEETKDLNWWQKFGAGYQQARTSAETTFLDLGEGVIDAILTGVGAVGEWLGADGLEDTMRDWTQAEWLSTLPQQDWYQNAMNVFGFDFLFGKEAKELARNKEALPEVVDNVASGIGSALGYAALNAVPYVGPALAWMGSGGVAAEEALNEGAGTTEAMLYGGAVGGVEMALEKGLGKALGAVGAGTGKIAGIGKGTSNAAKQVGKSAMSKVISNVGKNFFEEGMEEVVSELVDPLLKKGTYKRDETLKDIYGEQITAESLIETFLVGGLTGGIFEGANVATGIMSSGGVKNWNIRQEAQELQRINGEMEEAILKGDEQKVRKLQAQKDQAIKKVEQKFEEFVKETEANPEKLRKKIARAEYEVQRDTTREDLTLDAAQKVFNTKSKKDGTPKINVQYTQDVNTPSQYNAKNNTIYLNKQSLSSLDTALETIAHEAGHAIHTSGLNTDFVNRMTQDFTDFDSLIENEANKGTVNSIEEMISYYENQKGYGKTLEDSNLLKQRMQENKISKDQAYQELRDNYMLEEIANDIFGKKYFSNLLELQSVVAGKKPSVIKRMKEAFRKRFTNTQNKPSNYKEIMQIFTDGINQNFDRYVNTLSSEEQTTDKKYKLDEEELENDIDSNGNKLSKEQMEFFKDSAVRDENGNLLVVYHGTFYGGFTIFNENSFDNVVFFTNDKFMASTYSGYNENDIEFGKENTGLYSVYLNIEKPLIVDARDSNWDNITFYQKKPKDYQNEYDAVNSLKNLKGFVHNFFYKRTSKLDYRISSLQNVLSKIENGEISIEDKDFELELQQEIASLEKQKENLEDVLNPKNIQDLLDELNKNVENDLKFEFVKNDKWLQPTILLKGKYFEDYITLDFLANNVEKLNYYFDRMVQARALDRLESNFKTLMTTREIVEYAQKQGKYDGVIIRNVYDYSGPVGVDTETTPSQDVYVTLKSPNQIKLTTNKKPTENDDIRYKLSETSAENKLKEALKKEPKEKPTISEEEKIKVSKFKSTVKNAYNYFETLLEKYGDVYSAFDEMRGRYHLENWELSFMNEALYQNGKISEEDRDVIVDYLKIKDLDPYKQYQKYLNDGVEVDEQQEKVEEPKVEEQPKTETKKGLSPALQARLEAMKKKKGVSVEEKPKELVFDETSEVQKELLDYKQYDLTEYETKEELVNLGVDLITHIVNLNTGSKSLKTPDEIFSLGNLAKVIEGSTFEYEKSEEAFDIFTKRVNLIKKYHSQLKQVYEKMKNNNIKLGKQAIDDKLLEKMGFIATSYSSKNLSNTINFSTWIEDFNKALSLKEQNKGKVLEKREKVEEQKQEKQKTEEEAQRQRILDINASNVRKQYQDQIKNSLDNYPYEKDNVKDLKDDLDKLIGDINYKNYEDYEKYKIDSTKVPKESPIPQIEEKLKNFKKTIKANEESAKKVIKDNAGYISAFDYHYKGLLNDFKVGEELGKLEQKGKYKEAYEKGLEKLNSINNTIENSENLEDPSSMGLKDLISHLKKEAQKQEKELRPYIYDRVISDLETKLQEIESKLAKLDEYVQKLEGLKTKKEQQDQKEKELKEAEELKKKQDEEKKALEEKQKAEEEAKAKLEQEAKEKKETTTKPKTKKQPKEVIKFIRQTVILHTESAKSIKSEAQQTQLKTYTKQTCEDLIDMIGSMMSTIGRKKRIKTRVYFSEGGRKKAIDDLFKAFNTLANDPKALTEKVVEILKTGMEFQMPDYTIGADKIKKQSRKVYMTDENLWLQEDKKYVDMVELVNQELIKIVQDTIEGKGNPTVLAKEISTRTKKLEDRIAELEDQIDILVEQINNSKETVEVNIENATNNEELTKVNNELNQTNKKINKLDKELQKFTSKKLKVISDLKTKNAELKTDLLKQTKQVEKITKENIELKTDLEGVYQFRNTKEEPFLKRLMKKHFNLVGNVDLETVEKVSEKYNKGDIDGVVDILIDFLKGSKVQQEALEFNEETQKLETITEKVPFTDVYSDDLISRYREAFKQDIVDRINNKRTTKQSALPKALQEIEKLRTQIKTNTETAKRLTTLKGLMRRINNLARNKRPSALFNNIDKRFEAIAEQLGRYSQTTMLNGNFREILKEFKKFLTEDRFDGQTFQQMTGLEFPQELFEQLDKLENVQGQITLDELDLYNKILSALEEYIKKGTGQKLTNFKKSDGKTFYTVEEFVTEAIQEQEEILKKIGIGKEQFSKLLQTVDPRVVFKILSGFNENSKLYKLFEELQKGDTNSMAMQMELQEKLVEFNKKHKKFKKKVLGKKVEINGINATNGQFISIYKSLQREQAKKHILNSGIDLNGKVIRFTEQQLNDLESAIENQLELKKDGSLMKEYLKLTKDFFKKSGKVKAEIDELLYGYADIEKGEYFPIQISSLEFNRTLGEKKYVSKMAASFNYSWQNAVIGDLGAIKIGNVQDIIDLHSRQVADYYGYGLPLDMFNQIYSFKVYDKNSNRFVNLKRLINDRFGTNKKTGKYLAEDYIKILFDDIRGVNTYTGEVDGLFKRVFGSLRKKYSTYVLGANLKTAGVQLAAIPAARKYLSLKSMAKGLGKIDWEKYPLPPLGKYRTYDKTILKSETINDQISEIADKFGIIMTLTDQFTIKYAWKAALNETNFDKVEATKLFEKIVRETQPQYSAIERSALMRSSNDLIKLLTQFQSQNNKNFSTIMEVIYKAKYYKKMGMKLSKEDVQQFRRSIESIVFQGVFATAIAYLFKFLLHDLDDEDLDPLTIIGEFFNNNVLGLIPLMNNIKLDLTGEGKLGYVDIYETNLGMIDKLYDAVISLWQWTNPDKTMESKIYNSMNTIGVVTGIPTENLYKYSMAILKWLPFTKDEAFSWDANIKGISMTNKSEINEALQSGKINVAEQYYQTYTSNILELDTYTTKVLFDLYKEGYTNAYIKQVPKTLVVDNEQISVDREKFMKTYSKLTPKLKKLVKNAQFLSLEKEEKEKAISKLVNLYYSLAKKEILGVGDEEYTDLEYIAKYCNDFNQNTVSYLVHISNIEPTKLQTRKELVQRYINSLPLSAGEKYLLFVLSGYSISDKNRNILRSFLSSRGMPTKQINLFLE